MRRVRRSPLIPALALVVALATPTLAHAAAGSAPPPKPRAAAATLAGSPWPEMRHDSRNTASSPIRGRYRGGDRPWSFRTARGIFSTPVLGDDQTAYIGSADGNFYALDRHGEQRWRFHTGGIIDAAAALGRPVGEARRLPDHDRLRRRDPLPAAKRRPPAVAQAADPLAVPDPAAAGDRPARQLVGGKRRLRPRRQPVRRQHRRRRLLADPGRRAALDHPARQLGLDDAGVRRRGQQLLGLGRLLRLLARPAGQPALADVHPGLRHLVAGARLRRHGLRRAPSTAACTRSTRRPGAERWAFPTAAHVYASPALAADAAGNTSRDLHRLRRRLGLRGRPRRHPDLALRHRRAGALLAGDRPRPARRRADRLRRLLERQALRARRRDRRAALVVRHDAEQPGAQRPQRPQRLPGARQARRLHRRRARAGLVRALRLLPRGPRQPLHDRTRARSSAPTSTAPSRSPRAGRRSRARSWTCRRRPCSGRG